MNRRPLLPCLLLLCTCAIGESGRGTLIEVVHSGRPRVYEEDPEAPAAVAVAVPRPVLEVPAGPWRPTPPPEALPAEPAPLAPVTELTLRNGLRVVLVEHHRQAVVSLRLVFPSGAVADSDPDAGRSYLAVQLASDYYEKRADGERLVEEKSFRRQVAEAGGTARFEVGADYSSLGVSGYARDLGRYLRLLAGALTAPRLGAESFSSRRDSMLDTLEDLEIADAESFQILLSQAAFGAGHPYARPVLGTTESLNRMSMDDVRARQRALFTPRGATLLVVGDIRAEKLLLEINAALGRWQPPQEAPEARTQPPPRPSVRAEVGYIPRTPASTLLVCASRPLSDVRGPPAASELLATLVGHGARSRLAARLRDQSGLSYDVSSELVLRRHARALLVCAHLAAAGADEGLRHFQEVFEALRAQPPTEAELARVKAMRLAELESAGDDVHAVSSSWLQALALGERSPAPGRARAEIEAVTALQVQEAAQKVFDPKGIRWILSGERGPASQAVKANGLGALKTLSLRR